MRYIIDISPDVDSQIRDLIRQKRYVSVYQFISRAVEEMLHIEHQELSDRRELPSTEPSLRSDTSELRLLKKPDKEPEFLSEPHRLSDLYDGDPNEVPWLWGQINSVFCIKFVLRILAVRQLEVQDHPLDLPELKSVVADIGVRARRQLVGIDQKHKRRRGERFSVSLPEDTEKSRDRFTSQYLGYLDSNNKPQGALVWLGFVRIRGKRGSEQVLLTPAGYHFGSLSNPLIDQDHDHDMLPDSALGDKEVAFYVRHVLEHSPCEGNALQTVCILIKEGNNTPSKLEFALSKAKPGWTNAQVVTYKGGTLARLYQLRVISKTKTDGKLTYELTDLAKETSLVQ